MAFSTKIQIINAKVEQQSGGTLTLSGDTTVADSGSLKYASHPTFVADEAIVDKKYVDDNIVSGGTYNEDSPSTVEVGGIDVGTTLTGKTSNEILEEMLVPYLEPTFSSFSIQSQNTTIEVGDQIGPALQTFIWGTTNSGNVATNSITIRDVTAASDIATGLANDGNEAVDAGTINFNTVTSHSWRGEGDDTLAAQFNSTNFTVSSIYPYYWGLVSAPGEAGSGRPTLTSNDVTGGTKVVANSTGTITITFNSADSDYIWFATPDTSTTKTKWYETDINQGTIGGSVSPGGNLFPDPDSLQVSDSGWSNETYKVYVANYQTAAGTLEMRNS